MSKKNKPKSYTQLKRQQNKKHILISVLLFVILAASMVFLRYNAHNRQEVIDNYYGEQAQVVDSNTNSVMSYELLKNKAIKRPGEEEISQDNLMDQSKIQDDLDREKEEYWKQVVEAKSNYGRNIDDEKVEIKQNIEDRTVDEPYIIETETPEETEKTEETTTPPYIIP